MRYCDTFQDSSITNHECENGATFGDTGAIEDMVVDVRAKGKVLVVDDEPVVGDTIRQKLGLHGYKTIIRLNGKEAIRAVRRIHPDVVLLDVLMPGLSGLEALERIRKFSQVPVIIFSSNPYIFKYAVNMGVRDFIAKPLDLDDLVQKIDSILGGVQNTGALNRQN